MNILELPEIPRVAVCLPHYGDVSLAAARAFCAPSSRKHFDRESWVLPTKWLDVQTSSTTNCFNQAFAQAMAAYHNGEVDYLAMIHSDIEPANFWLNILYEEKRKSNADVISAVVAIKDLTGRTSTAIGDKRDPWKINRYVMLEDRAGLPETFGPEDVCGPDEVLVINTGCMLIDLSLKLWDELPEEYFSFNWYSRIRKVRGSKNSVVEFRPEDWEMSRALAASGANVRATWRVKTNHIGNFAWSNDPAEHPGVRIAELERKLAALRAEKAERELSVAA